MKRSVSGGLAALCFGGLLLAGALAPEHLGDGEIPYAGVLEAPPFGADGSGRPLLDYALQGAAVVALPSLAAGLVVVFLAIVGGLMASAGLHRLEAATQSVGELVSALPRMVIVLVVALVLQGEEKSLYPIALTWALLAAPGAMDEAASVAARLGGARFVEALRAHGFSRARIYLVHVIGLNLRPVVVRQGIDTVLQVVFLEIALSYLVLDFGASAFTHPDWKHSWADLLFMGYQFFLERPTGHALVLGLAVIGVVALMSLFVSSAVRAR